MEIRVLGPVGLVVDGDYVRLGGAKARTVLAALALRAGTVVSVEELIGAVWGDEPPKTAQSLVRTQIGELRKILAGAGGGGPTIVTQSPGYLLEPGAAAIDALTFRARTAEGRAAQADGDLELAVARFAEALEAWSGPALDGVAPALATAQASGLEQERDRVREDRIEAELALVRGHATANVAAHHASAGSDGGAAVDEVTEEPATAPEEPVVPPVPRAPLASGDEPAAAHPDIPAPRTDSPAAPPPGADPPAGGFDGTPAEPSRKSRRHRTLLIGLALLITLTIAAPAAVTAQRLLTSTTAFTTATAHAHAPTGNCTANAADSSDAPNGIFRQTWHTAAFCPNDAFTPLYLRPATGHGSPVVGRLQAGAPSKFLCWTLGSADLGGDAVYYYADADDQAPGQKQHHGWGFAPAAYLGIGADHGRSGLPECPAVPLR